MSDISEESSFSSSSKSRIDRTDTVEVIEEDAKDAKEEISPMLRVKSHGQGMLSSFKAKNKINHKSTAFQTTAAFSSLLKEKKTSPLFDDVKGREVK